MEVKCTAERRVSRSWHEAWERGTQDSSAQVERRRASWVGWGVDWMFGMQFSAVMNLDDFFVIELLTNYDQVR